MTSAVAHANPAGLGLRAPHLQAVLDLRPAVSRFEVHSENYFGGGALLHGLEAVRHHHPISLHGVAMGLLSADALDREHLERLARLVDRIEPVLVSEHLCWTRLGGVHFHDLLPAPSTPAMLARAVERIDQVQTRLKRRIAVENITRYVDFRDSTLPEGDFLRALVERAGCRLVLDLENLHLNELNLGAPALEVMHTLPVGSVAEFHIAGHAAGADGRCSDNHGAPVPPPVWGLLVAAAQRFGALPTVLERDHELPPLQDLLAECAHANRVLRLPQLEPA